MLCQGETAAPGVLAVGKIALVFADTNTTLPPAYSQARRSSQALTACVSKT